MSYGSCFPTLFTPRLSKACLAPAFASAPAQWHETRTSTRLSVRRR